MEPRPPDAIMHETTRCGCTAGNQPWCARCECLIQLAIARDVWHYEHERSWWQARADMQAVEVQRLRRRAGVEAVGNTMLGWLVTAAMWAYYVFWVFPRWVWFVRTSQIPHLPAPLGMRLPAPLRARVRAWCTVCERGLGEGEVRCPAHPEAEVMLVLRDEGGTDA